MKITEEMMEKARDVYAKADKMHDGWPEAPIRAALEAVAPLIVEECAKAADAWDTDEYVSVETCQEEIAASIRALAKTQPT